MNGKERILKQINKLATKLECLDRHNYSIKGELAYLKEKKEESQISVYRIRDNRIMCEEEHWQCSSSVGIVMQGPIMRKDNFTIETIRMIKKCYPTVKIVLSTWLNELSLNEKEEIERIGCILIENKSCGDEQKGVGEKTGHLNNQLLSTKEGIEYLYKNSDVRFVLKMRTDIRIYRPDFVQYFLDVYKLYNGQKKLVNVAFSNSLPGIPYHLSDFIWFGSIEDMRRLYSIPYRNEEQLKYIISFVENDMKYVEYKKSIREMMFKNYNETKEYIHKIDKKFMLLYHEESYIAYEYALLCGYTEENAIDQYLEFLKKHLIIIDDFDIMVYWKKSLYSIVQTDYSIKIDQRLSHAKWLHLYLEDKNNYE